MKSMPAFDYVYKLNKIPLQSQNEQNTPKTSKSPKMPTKSLNLPKYPKTSEMAKNTLKPLK